MRLDGFFADESAYDIWEGTKGINLRHTGELDHLTGIIDDYAKNQGNLATGDYYCIS